MCLLFSQQLFPAGPYQPIGMPQGTIKLTLRENGVPVRRSGYSLRRPAQACLLWKSIYISSDP